MNEIKVTRQEPPLIREREEMRLLPSSLSDPPSTMVKTGTKQVNMGTTQAKTGSTQAKTGSTQVKTDTTQVKTGVKTDLTMVTSGVTEVKTGNTIQLSKQLSNNNIPPTKSLMNSMKNPTILNKNGTGLSKILRAFDDSGGSISITNAMTNENTAVTKTKLSPQDKFQYLMTRYKDQQQQQLHSSLSSSSLPSVKIQERLPLPPKLTYASIANTENYLHYLSSRRNSYDVNRPNLGDGDENDGVRNNNVIRNSSGIKVSNMVMIMMMMMMI